jgi:ribosomal protein L29
VKDDSPVDLFLQEVMNFIEYGDNDDEDGLEGTIDTHDDNDATDENEAQVTSTQQVVAADSSAPGENDSIRKKIAEVKTSMVEFEELIKPLNEKRKKLTDRRNTAGALKKPPY